MKPRQKEPLTLWDRLACGFAGAVFGIVYGCLLAVLAWPWELSSSVCGKIVMTSTGVFGVLGVLMGPFVGDLIGDMLHLFLAMAGWKTSKIPSPGGNERLLFRAFLVLIAGAAIVMYWHQ